VKETTLYDSETVTGVVVIEVPADYTGPKPITKTFQFGDQEPQTVTFEPELVDGIVAQLGWEQNRFTDELLLEPVKVISIEVEEGHVEPSDATTEYEMSILSVEEIVPAPAVEVQ
jgi:hypothetical protein